MNGFSVHIGVYGDVVRVKILFNKKDTALIQFNSVQQAQTGNITLQLAHFISTLLFQNRKHSCKHKCVLVLWKIAPVVNFFKSHLINKVFLHMIPKVKTCIIHVFAQAGWGGGIVVYMTGGSDVFFGLKIYNLGTFLGQEICHVFF